MNRVRNAGMNEILREGCGDCEKENGQFVCSTPEDSITCFWANSINRTPEKFNFEENSRHFKRRLRGKLAEHGLLGKEEFVHRMEGIYGERTELSQWTQNTAHITITEDELRDVLDEHQWKRNKETFETYETFQTLEETHERAENLDRQDTSEKVKTFDSLIHAQHETGEIVQDVDIDELREEFEENIPE